MSDVPISKGVYKPRPVLEMVIMTIGKATEETKGAWIVHHGQKVAADMSGSSQFPAQDTAAKATSLLSQLAGTHEATVGKARVEALAKGARLNPRTEALLDILSKKHLIDRSSSGDVVVLGVTSRATLAQASDIFEGEGPSAEEQAIGSTKAVWLAKMEGRGMHL